MASGDITFTPNYQSIARCFGKLNRALVSGLANPDTKRAIATEALRLVGPYVPYGRPSEDGTRPGGTLYRSGHVVSHARYIRIVWSATSPEGFHYNEYQFNGPLWWNRNRTVHPLARSRWTEVLQPGGDKYYDLAEFVHHAIKEGVKKEWNS